jgi:plastocyanin
MRRLIPFVAAALVATASCSDGGPIQPPSGPLESRAEVRTAAAVSHPIQLLDKCEPASFNAALGAGTCVKAGTVTFNNFIAQLTNRGFAEAWRFTPTSVQAKVGDKLLALNQGGEEHTFTEVDAFGGGIVPKLNELSHNPIVAPECNALLAGDFIPSGGSHVDELHDPGTELYQCCIHPWMRTVIHISN